MPYKLLTKSSEIVTAGMSKADLPTSETPENQAILFSKSLVVFGETTRSHPRDENFNQALLHYMLLRTIKQSSAKNREEASERSDVLDEINRLLTITSGIEGLQWSIREDFLIIDGEIKSNLTGQDISQTRLIIVKKLKNDNEKEEVETVSAKNQTPTSGDQTRRNQDIERAIKLYKAAEEAAASPATKATKEAAAAKAAEEAAAAQAAEEAAAVNKTKLLRKAFQELRKNATAEKAATKAADWDFLVVAGIHALSFIATLAIIIFAPNPLIILPSLQITVAPAIVAISIFILASYCYFFHLRKPSLAQSGEKNNDHSSHFLASIAVYTITAIICTIIAPYAASAIIDLTMTTAPLPALLPGLALLFTSCISLLFAASRFLLKDTIKTNNDDKEPLAPRFSPPSSS